MKKEKSHITFSLVNYVLTVIFAIVLSIYSEKCKLPLICQLNSILVLGFSMIVTLVKTMSP